MKSEFYHLRRTAIKDLSAYCGFLLGFLGSAPLAWELLAGQLDAGRFARGLWYFFVIVTGAGVFSGIAGLGIGFVIGVVWEQLHRYRRRERGRQQAKLEARLEQGERQQRLQSEHGIANPNESGEAHRLQLISVAPPAFPQITGRRVASVRFLVRGIEMDFGGVVVVITGNPVITAGSRRFRFPDSGSRDALCSLIGARVERMRFAPGDRPELQFDTGWELVIPRASSAVA